MTSQFCVAWLRVACAVTIVIGLVAAAGSSQATDGLWLWLFDLLKWPLDGDPSHFGEVTSVVNAVLGGVMVGWASLMYSVVARRFSAGHYELSGPMLQSVLIWFVVDSTGSVAAGLLGNIVFNASFLMIFVPPLLFLSRARASESADA